MRQRRKNNLTFLAIVGAGLVIFTWTGNEFFRAFEPTSNSRSIGTPANGSIDDAKRIPTVGPNYRPYSRLGATIGRTCVHHAVLQSITDSYNTLGIERDDLQFVYGETGWCWGGGEFAPHRTHQNGLSVDFMVPVRKSGKSVPLPHSVVDGFGYELEFSPEGRVGEYHIDFEAILLHLNTLDKAARKNNARIKRVIFAPDLQKKLFAAKGSKRLRKKFNKKPSWVRHDDHYHVDFVVDDKVNGQPPPTR